jgi:hypothetical protein
MGAVGFLVAWCVEVAYGVLFRDYRVATKKPD